MTVANRRFTLPLSNGHAMQCELFLPARRNTKRAAVIAIHDIFGLTDDIRRIASRLADAGYPAVVPDLYDNGSMKPLCVTKTLLAHETGKGLAFEQLEAVRQWLLIEPELDVQQVGVMGFCMGGRFALLYGAQAPLAVVAPFYGMVPPKAEDLQGICPVVGGWGEKDMIMGKHGKLLNKHLDQLGVEHDVKSYPDAGHSYMNNHDTFIFRELGDYSPLRSKYNEAASEDSWERVFAFFNKVL
mgnify:FL=1